MAPDQILLVQSSFAMAGADGESLARHLARTVRRASRPAALAAGVDRFTRRLGALPPGLRDWTALVDAVSDALGAPLPSSAAEAWRAWHRVALGDMGDLPRHRVA